MKNFLTALTLVLFLFISCSKSNPKPTCEEGGTEVTP